MTAQHNDINPATARNHPPPDPPLPQSLRGQTALVTGANSGIGHGVAVGLAKAGADVVVNYVADPDAADAVVKEIEDLGQRALAIKADVGKIICMSSVHQRIAWAGHANYAASKGGIAMLMQTMAQELAPKRIRVNAIAPGAIQTPINTAAWKTPEAYSQLMTLVPYGRIGEPSDIAQAAVWLASDASDYVTGITLFVDGGMSLYPGFEHKG